jgi:dienelactone hydrolase
MPIRRCPSAGVFGLGLLVFGLVAAAFGQAPSTTPEARTQQVLDLLFAQKYETIYEMLAPEVKALLTLDAWKTAAEKIVSLGEAQSKDKPRVQSLGSMTVVTIPVHWASTALDFNVRWNEAGQIAGIRFQPPQQPWQRPAYSKPDSFTEREVTVGDDEWKLPGTLAVPSGKGPFPALVLVHGSGPNDRDETVGGAKVFRDLAEGLASRGIAVLRYDKRTNVYPAKCAADPNFTMNQETVEDAIRAAGLLRTDKTIDPGRVFVLGHSQGGYMAPRIIKRDPKLAGAVILAGNLESLEDAIIRQSEYLAGLKGELTSEGKKRLEDLKHEVEKVKKLEPGKDNPAKVLGIPASYWLDLKGYNPVEEVSKTSMPLLILQGERDYQVTMKDFGLWKVSLEARKKVTLRSYPQLNHLFVAGEGKSSGAEYQKPGHVAPEVIDDIANWILRM